MSMSFEERLLEKKDKEISELCTINKNLESWKNAIDDVCVNNWITVTTPQETINNLIACVVNEALDPLISEKPAKWVAEISELKENIKTIETNYDALQSPMPCGHLARYAVNVDEGTQYCVMCDRVAQMKALETAIDVLSKTVTCVQLLREVDYRVAGLLFDYYDIHTVSLGVRINNALIELDKAHNK